MKLAALFTGGKDSTFAVKRALEAGHEVAVLVTMRPKNPESFMFHAVNVNWTPLQAEAMGIPLMRFDTEGKKEEEVEDLARALLAARKEYGVEGVVSGVIASRFQLVRVKRACLDAGLEPLTPLWGRDAAELMREYLDWGMEFVVTAAMAGGLDERWLGRRVDRGALEELAALSEKWGLHVAGEGGEYETFVTWCPLFSRRIRIIDAKAEWRGYWGVYRILKAELE